MRNLLLVVLLMSNWVAMGQKKTMLPNGWSITPAGQTIDLKSDFPLNLAVSPNRQYAAVTNNGVSQQSIQLIDLQKQVVLCTAPVSHAWFGLKFSDDGKNLYASGGNKNQIYKYWITHDTLVLTDTILLGARWPEKISPAGIELADRQNLLFAVSKESNALYVVDLVTKSIQKTIPLGEKGYNCLKSPDSKKLYISVWGGDKILVYDIAKGILSDSVRVGRNPNDLAITKNGRYLFVANATDNTVSVVDTKNLLEIEVLNTALFPDAPQGSTPNALALSQDETTLYIANADNNDISVFDVSKPGACFSKGFIPTGWYPTGVKVVGNKLVVINGKGNSSFPNPQGPQPRKQGETDNYKKANSKSNQYIGSLMKGTLETIPVPDAKEMKEYSRLVYANTPYTKTKETEADGEKNNPIPTKADGVSPIKHVFYVLKENRTYDQVLSDIRGGNGDTSILLFGQKITPNQHKLATDFVLLDNFYVDAEVSADGHNWSLAAYATDYIEKTWPTSYGGRGGTYDYAGNFSASQPKIGYLWDFAIKKGLTFRDYGEFTDDDGNSFSASLKNNMCKDYPGWNLKIKDIDREKVWERDFDSLVKMNAVPQLNILYLPNDHTAGLNKKNRTPDAYVADNDQAVGLFMEHLSHSPVWNDCAVFILEDDAQNGPDHVDAHRSTAYVAGPFVKRNFIDHSMYSTSSMLRTIELILGLPPMSQYDAGAKPMFKCFTNKKDTAAFDHITPYIDLDAMNEAYNGWPDNINFKSPDRVPDTEMTELVWHYFHPNTAAPKPVRAAFVAVQPSDDDDD